MLREIQKVQDELAFFLSVLTVTIYFSICPIWNAWNGPTFKFVNNNCPYYLKENFKFAPHCRIDTRNEFAKLKVPFHKTNMGQKAISLVGPSLWNSLPEVIKKT